MNDKELLDMFTEMLRAHSAHREKRMGAIDVSVGQGGVLFALGSKGPMSQQELASFRHVTPATISNMIMRMERDGLVERSAAATGKANEVRLTKSGMEKYKQLDALMGEEIKTTFAGLSEEEKDLAGRLFEKLTDNVSSKK